MTLGEATLDAELNQETRLSPAIVVSCARKVFDARIQSSKLTRPRREATSRRRFRGPVVGLVKLTPADAAS
jgi:hypothetical protein